MVPLILPEEREHLGMDDPGAGGEPLHVAGAVAGRGAERVGVVDIATADEGDGLEATVGMLGEARHGAAVVHAPAVGAGEIASYGPSLEAARVGPQCTVAGRVGVVVMHAEKERVARLPRRRTKNEGVQHRRSVGQVHPRTLVTTPTHPQRRPLGNPPSSGGTEGTHPHRAGRRAGGTARSSVATEQGTVIRRDGGNDPSAAAAGERPVSRRVGGGSRHRP